MFTPKVGINTGVIIKAPLPERIGAVVPLPTNTNTNADWRTFESPGEWQKDMTINWESEACMSFARGDNFQSYMNWLLDTNQIQPAQMAFLKDNGYFDSDGKIAISDRFIATMSGTTVDGNDFENVWGGTENFGLVPDSLWPMPTAEMNTNPANAWKTYYATPPTSVTNLGKEFLTYFQLPWRWLVSDGNGATQEQFAEWLKIAPIHIATAVCSPWNTDQPISGCGCGAQHGTQLSRVDVGVVNNILDHYVPFDKQLEANYCLSYAVQGWVVQIPRQVPETTPVAPSTVQVVQDALPQIQQAITHLQTIPTPQKTVIENILKQLLTDLGKLVGL